MDQRSFDDMEEMATTHVDLKEYEKAEQLYREILTRRLEQEGIPATYRDMYNLAAMLVNNQKYEEALPLLRDLFMYLSQRTIGREMPEFMEQEVSNVQVTGQMHLSEVRAIHESSFLDAIRKFIDMSIAGFKWISEPCADVKYQ